MSIRNSTILGALSSFMCIVPIFLGNFGDCGLLMLLPYAINSCYQHVGAPAVVRILSSGSQTLDAMALQCVATCSAHLTFQDRCKARIPASRGDLEDKDPSSQVLKGKVRKAQEVAQVAFFSGVSMTSEFVINQWIALHQCSRPILIFKPSKSSL